MKADIGDFETSRGYPLDLSAAATEIPGYEGCSAALLAAYNALPLGAQFIIRTGIATIPAGAVFRKTSQLAYAVGGRITRVVNPTVDTITVGSAVDSFVANLTATGGAGTARIQGTFFKGNGAKFPTAPVTIVGSGIAGQTVTGVTITGGLGSVKAIVAGPAASGAQAELVTDASGALDTTFAYSGGGAIVLVVKYLGLEAFLTATVT